MGFIHEHIILPLSDLAKGEQVHRHLRELKRLEQASESEMTDYQLQRLHLLLNHVATAVPFYREWFVANSLAPGDIRSLSDLRRLPIVDKAFMRREGVERFTADGQPDHTSMAARSSGSTGEPFSFYISKEAYSVNMAAKLRTWYQAGYRLGDRYMKIANGARHGRLKTLQDRVNRCVYVPFFAMSDEALAAILEQIERTRPTIIRSYPTPLFLLAQYRNQHPGYRFTPRHVMTTGSILPPAYRAEIERAFGCDVIDSYSCEGTPNTYETTAHDGYRVTRAYGIIEVLDESGEPVSDGVGRVVSTDLWNLATPFLRYDTQDLVEVRGGRIQRILGRECETLIDAGGRRFMVHNFVGFFQEDDRPVRRSVTAYQVVKRKAGGITFRLVVNEQYTGKTERYIIDFWQEQLGLPVSVTLVDEIPLMKNNKRLTIVEE
ncbi:MAG: phenylacetate--CoA ligase family protein [Bacteroidales bacterium]|nr:phenylacetate--CoA ligase family protein [Bacteroidales bacterium]